LYFLDLSEIIYGVFLLLGALLFAFLTLLLAGLLHVLDSLKSVVPQMH
jgi:hypothetical protein